MVCANPDIVVERGERLVYCAGALARLYAEIGGKAVLAGKPHAPIYEAAQRILDGLGGSGEVLAIGDGLPTDIRGAHDNGVPVLFVTGGIHAADFGPPDDPDVERVEARLKAEGMSAVACIPRLAWEGARVTGEARARRASRRSSTCRRNGAAAWWRSAISTACIAATRRCSTRRAARRRRAACPA